MAVYHFHSKFMQRSAGASSVAAAAYRCAIRIEDERIGLAFDFRRKVGVVHTQIIAPDNAPDWVHNRTLLWNACERAERRIDGQPGREVRVALPKELSLDEQVELLEVFCREHFVARGMVVDFAIHHDNPDNPHAHIGLTTRAIDETGFLKKERSWVHKSALMMEREGWACAANLALRRAGYSVRIDHRSYADMGLGIEPTCHVGKELYQHRRQGRDVVRERLENNDRVAHKNGVAIARDPRIALEALMHHEATFTHHKAAIWLHTHTFGEAQFQDCLSKVMAHPDVVRVGKSDQGIVLFSTKQMLHSEQEMLRLGASMAQAHSIGAADCTAVKSQIAAHSLSPEQATALRHVTQKSGDLALVEGLAGTGKSYMLKAACTLWEQDGHRVIGMALSGKAAEGLEHAAGIDSRSVASWEWAWKEKLDTVSRGDVVVVDEAGMLGTQQVERLLRRTHEAGAKLVLVGDSGQLLAVEAGCPFVELSRRNTRATLQTIYRQDSAWMRQASQHLAQGKVSEAFGAYRKQGMVHEHTTQEQACDALVRRYLDDAEAHPGQTQVALSLRRADVHVLNQGIRQMRMRQGELGTSRRYGTPHGAVEMAPRDRLCFLQNDRRLGVKNGTLGTVVAADRAQIVVRLDGPGKHSPREVRFDPRTYVHFTHGYALTVHKSQGITVDKAHVLATKAFDRRSAYVAMTRHRQGLEVHYGAHAFTGTSVEEALGRSRDKSLALNYVEEHERNQALRQKLVLEQGRMSKQTLQDAKEAWRSCRAAQIRLGPELGACEREARKPRLTPETALAQSPRGAQIQATIREAQGAKHFWEEHSRRQAAAHPIAATLGLSDRKKVYDPLIGQPIRISEGMEVARKTFQQARLAYEQLERSPEAQHSAQEAADKYNAAIEQAKVRYAQLNAELKRIEAKMAALLPHARTSYLSRDSQQEQESAREAKEFERALETAKSVKRHLQETATRPAVSFEQALAEQPRMRAAKQHPEAAFRAREQPKRRRGVEDSGRMTEPPSGAEAVARELRGARQAIREALGDPQVQREAGAQARQSREARDYARAQLPDLCPIRQKKLSQLRILPCVIV